MFNPLKVLGGFVGGKIIRPVLRTLAGEAGVELRRTNELRRRAAIAAVAYAHAKMAAEADAGSTPDNSVNAWQAVMRGRSIGRGKR